MEYYVFLLLIYLTAGFGELNLQKHKKSSWYLFLLIFPIFALAAFRSVKIGNDTIAYSQSFETISHASNVGTALLWSRLEPGYVAICYYASRIGMSFFQFQILTTIFMYAGFYFFIRRYSHNYAFSCLLLIGAGVMAGTMNTTRMHIAIAILLFAIPFLLSRKWIWFLIITFCAILFHKSSFVFVIMLPICLLPYSRRLIILMIASAFFILYMGVEFFQLATDAFDMYEGYVDGRYFNDFNTTGIIVALIINTVMCYFLWSEGYFKHPQYVNDSIKRNRKIVAIEYYNMMAMLVTLCLSIVGLGNTIMSRISGYFSICLLVMLPGVLYDIKRKDRRSLVYIVIALFYISYFLAIRILRPEWNHITPYEWGF